MLDLSEETRLWDYCSSRVSALVTSLQMRGQVGMRWKRVAAHVVSVLYIVHWYTLAFRHMSYGKFKDSRATLA